MQQNSIRNANDSSLRFVFNDAVFSCSMSGQATFGDIAETLFRLCGNSNRHPLSIAVTMAKPHTLHHTRN